MGSLAADESLDAPERLDDGEVLGLEALEPPVQLVEVSEGTSRNRSS
jgi:hypothetical protein